MIGDNNREFYIEIDKKLNLKEMVLTICHEMVHVKQYARNEKAIESEACRLEPKLALECWENNII